MRPTPWQAALIFVAVIAAGWAVFAVTSLSERVWALEWIFRDDLIDEAVAACNEAAINDREDARFKRSAVVSARFEAWRHDTPTGSAAAGMVIYTEGDPPALGCRYSPHRAHVFSVNEEGG